jgi:glycosyltransferase involved in cell wall biosynthesis
MSVIFPAKDEAANLPATQAALAAQTNAQGQSLAANSYEVIVLANNCQDATAAVVRNQARRFPELSIKSDLISRC